MLRDATYHYKLSSIQLALELTYILCMSCTHYFLVKLGSIYIVVSYISKLLSRYLVLDLVLRRSVTNCYYNEYNLGRQLLASIKI